LKLPNIFGTFFKIISKNLAARIQNASYRLIAAAKVVLIFDSPNVFLKIFQNLQYF